MQQSTDSMHKPVGSCCLSTGALSITCSALSIEHIQKREATLSLFWTLHICTHEHCWRYARPPRMQRHEGLSMPLDLPQTTTTKNQRSEGKNLQLGHAAACCSMLWHAETPLV